MAREVDIAKFSSVMYNEDTDEVFVTFKVHNSKYRDFVMRWAAREDGRLIIRGEHLSVIESE
jgi:hypothetical protein